MLKDNTKVTIAVTTILIVVGLISWGITEVFFKYAFPNLDKF